MMLLLQTPQGDRSTPKAAVFALEAATSVRSNTLFEPMMRSSFASIFASFPK